MLLSRLLVICSLLAIGIIAGMGVSPAYAQTVNCTGTPTATNDTRVTYRPSTQTCTIIDGSSSSSEQGIIDFAAQPTTAGGRVFVFSDNDLNGSFALQDHQGINDLAGSNIAAGASAIVTNVSSGTYTTTITSATTATTTSVLTITYTVVANTSMNITSASIEVGGTSVSVSVGDGSVPVPRALQASVSRSQTEVVATNIGNRLASIGNSPVGIGGISAPGGTSTGNTVNVPDADQANLTNSTETTGYDQLPLRQMAMSLSFDSSQMLLSAAQEASGEVLSPAQRSNLLIDRPLTVWGYGSYTDVDNDFNDGTTDSRYNGDVWGYNIGADYRIRDNLYAGASMGLSKTDLTTSFNSGDYEEDSWTFTPYVVYTPTDEIKLSGIIGYGFGSIDQTRDDDTVSSSTDSSMFFAAINGSYTITPLDDFPLDVKATVSFQAAHKEVDAYTESDGTEVASSTTNTRQLKPGLEAAYSFDLDEATVLQPFVKTELVYDFTDAVNDDSQAFDVGGGLRIGSLSGFSGSIEANTQLGRQDYSEYTVSGLLAYGFSLGGDGTEAASFVEPYVKSDFNESGQVLGTGLNFHSHDKALGASLNLSQTRATNSDDANQLVDFTINLRF